MGMYDGPHFQREDRDVVSIWVAHTNFGAIPKKYMEYNEPVHAQLRIRILRRRIRRIVSPTKQTKGSSIQTAQVSSVFIIIC
ncbi:MAG: hypothetical protein ACI9G1_004586 [Pirellulaceae bacterium]|jgi:hypothetical protein